MSRLEQCLSPFQGLEIYLTINPGRRSPTRFALGYYLSGLQPSGIAKPAKIGFTQFAAEKSRALKAGDEVLISGVRFTGRGTRELQTGGFRV